MSPAFAYIETSIPAGVTIDTYRRNRPKKLTLWRRILRAGKRG